MSSCGASRRDLLGEYFGIADDAVTIHHTRPDNLIARFTWPEDLETVLSIPWPAAAPLQLHWRRSTGLFMASTRAFRFRVLVGMKGIPSHARSADIAQTILGTSCA